VDSLVTVAEVRAAAELLAGVARVTPLEGSRALAELVSGPVWLKCENLQRAGSFKIRGAYVRIARLTDEQRRRGVVAASAGNHGQGVALAASLLGARATVFMPQGAPLPKIEATRAYGATVVLAGGGLEEALEQAAARAGEDGSTLIHPFDHRDIIAGQGTVGLEILDQCPDVRTVVVSTGGGGLISGVAAAIKGQRPEVRVIAAQAAGAAAWAPSLAAGRPLRLASTSTIADGIAVAVPGEVTFAHVTRLVDGVVEVSDEDISAALLLMLERAKLVVEPAGAAGVAAVQRDPGAFTPPVVCVLSGGNIDPLLLNRVIRHGLVAAGRYLSLQVAIPDVPGSLASLLDVLGAVSANVLDVVHLRTQGELTLEEVDIGLQLETRGPDHAADVRAALTGVGYRVR
jgi:threonine dehydratase